MIKDSTSPEREIHERIHLRRTLGPRGYTSSLLKLTLQYSLLRSVSMAFKHKALARSKVRLTDRYLNPEFLSR